MRVLSIFMATILSVASFWVSVAAAASSQTPAPAAGERLVTVYDQSKKQVILTKATTVRDALKQADVIVAKDDVVEPGIDTKLVATEYTVNVYRAHPVMVVDGMRKQRVLSPYTAPKDIAKSAHIELHDEDIVKLTKPDDIVVDGGGMRMEITRATPVNLMLYGKAIKAYTQAKTVAELLDSKNIQLGKDDTLSVKRSAVITKDMTIEIWRNGVQTVTQEEVVTFPVRHIEDADQPIGYKKIQTPGTNGKKNVTYEITMKNGKEVDRKEIQSITTEQPKEQVEIVGVKPTFTGNFAAALEKLRSCEGSYTSNTGNGYYGAYQYDIGTWGNYKGYPNAAVAPPAVQDEKVWETYQRRGWSPWPNCGAGLPDTYR